MKKILNKTGGILLCLLPFIAGIILQYILSFICMLFQAVFMYLDSPGFQLQNYMDSLMTSNFNTLVMFSYGITAALLMGIWYFISAVPRHMPKRRPGQIFHVKTIIGIILLVPALQSIISYFISFISILKPSWYSAYDSLMESAGMDDITILLALYSLIVAPVCEELIFRGVTLHYAQKVFPFWAANLLQSLLFGLYHMNLVQGIYAFLVGLFCGYIFHAGQSIYLSIAYHILFNLWGTWLYQLFYTGDSLLIHVMQFAAALLAMGYGLLLCKKGAPSREHPDKLPLL